MFCGLVALPVAATAAEGVAPPAARHIGSRKQLFIDERFVAEKRDVALVVNPPVSPARGPPTDCGEFVQIHDDRDVFQATD
jgi:hypothetical protein